MRRYLLILLVVLTLTGCAEDSPGQTMTTAAPSETTTAPLEEPGLYDPDSLTEKQTKGAVRSYPLNSDNCSGMAWMGEDFVLFTTGETGTNLTLYTGENLCAVKSAELNCFVFPGDPYVQVNENGVAYFDSNDNSVVFLNPDFQESRRVGLPENIQGTPMLSEDWSTIYYCTDSAIRGLNLDTGISRLVRGECVYQWQSLQQLCWNDQILKWFVSESDTEETTYFISAQTGEIQYSSNVVTDMITEGTWYYACILDGAYPDYLFGHSKEENCVLKPLRSDVSVWPVLELEAVVTTASDETGCNLDYYDLNTGKRTASIRLEQVTGISRIVADPQSGGIWILDFSLETYGQSLYLWQPELSSINDTEIYTAPYYTAENPDLEGLERCKAKAEEISDRYECVDIIIGEDAKALEPWDHTFQTEYKVVAYENGLTALDQALSRYPEGFLQQLAERTDSGAIRISLLRSINGDAEKGTIPSSGGIQYWMDGNAYIALSMDVTLEQILYHEMFHMIDTYVLTSCVAYDEWNELNPRGFEYDYDYIKNQNRIDFEYLDDENRSFIDMYSMSFPSEDRARIMEYAMLPDNENYFISETMQRKLERLCEGIRIAFDLEDWEEPLPWETYLIKDSVSAEQG